MLFSTSGIIAQYNGALLFIDSVTIIGELRDGKIYGGPDQVVNSILGNTFYDGESTDREDILYLIGVTEPFGKKDQFVYFEDGRQIAFTMARGVLYLGEVFDPELEKLLIVLPPEENFYQIRSGLDNAYLGTIASNDPLRPAELFACLHQYVLHYNLDRQINDRIAALYPDTQFPMDGDSLNTRPLSGRMRPYMDSNPYYEWEWDGKTLKPVWGIRSEDEWSFDGQYIRPLYGLVSRQEWVWDGSMLKPYWAPEPGNQWLWDQNILRRFWNGNPDEEWKINDGMVSPHWNPDPSRTWIVEGNFPLPLIALIVLGVADR